MVIPGQVVEAWYLLAGQQLSAHDLASQVVIDPEIRRLSLPWHMINVSRGPLRCDYAVLCCVMLDEPDHNPRAWELSIP